MLFRAALERNVDSFSELVLMPSLPLTSILSPPGGARREKGARLRKLGSQPANLAVMKSH